MTSLGLAGEAGIFASLPFYPMFSGVPNGPLRLSPPQVHAAVHNSGELAEEAEIVYAHHEQFDGNGKSYPRGLRADQVTLGARIFSIVDTYDAITSDRPYRAGQPPQVARAEIEKHSGTQFDPSLAEQFARIPDSELIKVRQQFPDVEGTQ